MGVCSAIKPERKRSGGVGSFLTTFSVGSGFSARPVAVSLDNISMFSTIPADTMCGAEHATTMPFDVLPYNGM
jgi:hypothetical protein